MMFVIIWISCYLVSGITLAVCTDENNMVVNIFFIVIETILFVYILDKYMNNLKEETEP